MALDTTAWTWQVVVMVRGRVGLVEQRSFLYRFIERRGL